MVVWLFVDSGWRSLKSVVLSPPSERLLRPIVDVHERNNRRELRTDFGCARHPHRDYPHPYQGFSSGSTCRPSSSLLSPLNKSTTAISSTIPSSSRPSFRAAEICTLSQYLHPMTAETATAIISLVMMSSFPVLTITAFIFFQLASR